MKFLHTADLHLGKTVNEFSMMEEQKNILEQILGIAKAERVDALLIAGDVYDRPIPSTEAVALLDAFLTALSEDGIPVLLVSGNHDSGERVAFADRILEKQGLYICGGYDGALKRVVLSDEWGEVDFVLMPYLKPAAATPESMLAATPMPLDLLSRHVLVTHYFVTGEDGRPPELSDSESGVNVGGLDNVPAALFAAFDYVALGHIHKRQKIGEREVWYAGSPLKYSFSEVDQKKGVNLVTMGEKGDISVEQRVLYPLHEMRVIRGRLAELTRPEVAEAADRQDYIKAQLTDTEELIEPMDTLRSVYPNIMQIELLKNLAKGGEGYEPALSVKNRSTGELFGQFYELLRGEPMDGRRAGIVDGIEKRLRDERGMS